MQSRTSLFAGLVCVLVVVCGAAFVWWQKNYSAAAAVAAADPLSTVEQSPTDAPATSVEMSPDKLVAANVAIAEASTTTLRLQNTVPGRLQYDDRRHVEVRSAASGILTDIRVNPGDFVNSGDIIVELNSPEVGNARADVMQRQAELKQASENRNWQQSTCGGLEKLSEAIRSRISVEDIRRQFKDVVLGKSREQLLSAYSELLLAESLASVAERNAKEGIISGRVIEERLNNRNNTEATLLTALEERTFEAKQSCRAAEAQVADAERRLRISVQTVRTLLGKSTASKDDSTASDSSIVDPDLQPESLSVVQLRAPFSGTVERRMFSKTERVSPGDSLVTIADTSTLWVAADLRERDWNALSLKPGDEIQVQTSVPGMESTKAVVHFLGREVDPATNAIPLIATVENADGKLRPGMFVQVAVPVAAARQALMVPESSVLEHDRQAFVFTPMGESSFRRVDIQAGQHSGGLVEVLSGLNGGEKVVVSGGFHLKSELLLQGEAE